MAHSQRLQALGIAPAAVLNDAFGLDVVLPVVAKIVVVFDFRVCWDHIAQQNAGIQ